MWTVSFSSTEKTTENRDTIINKRNKLKSPHKQRDGAH